MAPEIAVIQWSSKPPTYVVTVNSLRVGPTTTSDDANKAAQWLREAWEDVVVAVEREKVFAAE